MNSLQATNDRLNQERMPQPCVPSRSAVPCRALAAIALLLLLAAGAGSTAPVMSALHAICETFGRSLDAAANQLAGRLLGQSVHFDSLTLMSTLTAGGMS